MKSFGIDRLFFVFNTLLICLKMFHEKTNKPEIRTCARSYDDD